MRHTNTSDEIRTLGLITDADNTLWDTDGVYASAQLWLLSVLDTVSRANHPETERLAFIREIDQGIAKLHHSGLKYPTLLLVQTVRMVLAGVELNVAINDTISRPERSERDMLTADQFDKLLARIPPLRPGVQEGLQRIRRMRVPILVATEGAVERCRERLTHWGISADHILCAPKSQELFARAARLLRLPSSQCVVVGDQLDRDVAFANLAGCKTIYFPGGFMPGWSPSLDEARPHFVVQSFSEVATICEDLLKGDAQR